MKMYCITQLKETLKTIARKYHYYDRKIRGGLHYRIAFISTERGNAMPFHLLFFFLSWDFLTTLMKSLLFLFLKEDKKNDGFVLYLNIAQVLTEKALLADVIYSLTFRK